MMKQRKNSYRLSIVLCLTIVIALVCGGCSFLKSFTQNYISIYVENGILLAESENNEQICKFRIDATITNNYGKELNDVEISLKTPSNVTVTNEGANATFNAHFDDGESIGYSWFVKVPKTSENQNLEYSVSANSSEINEFESYASIYVKGINLADNRMSFSKDTWNFKNFSSLLSIPITQEDFDALLVGLSNADIEFFKKKVGEGQGGYCYGFASSSILVKMGQLDVEDIDSSKSELHDIDSNTESKSVLAYYYLTQWFSNIMDDKIEFMERNDGDKLRIIEEKAIAVESGGSPFILSFYTQPDDKGGHAVVAYSHESGVFSKNNRTYDSRILIYDSNYPKWNEDSCLYYNTGTAEWYIPNYPDSSRITRALSDVNLMNTKNIEDNRKSSNSYITAKGNEQITIYSGDSLVADVDGTAVSKSNTVTAFRDDGDDKQVTIALPYDGSEEEYIILSRTDGNDLDLTIRYNDYYICASSTSPDSITFSPEGAASIEGNTKNFDIQITANDGHYSTEWYTIDLSGKSGVNPKVQVNDEGYLISGNELKNLEVYAENKKGATKLELNTVNGEVLISQEDENLCAKIDENNDGVFEAIIQTGRDTPVRNPLNSDSGFNWWIIAIVIGAVVLGVAAFFVIRMIIKNKERKQSQMNDDWWM